MKTYLDHGKKMEERIGALLGLEGQRGMPTAYAEFMKLDHRLRKIIGVNLPLVLSDDYEHFMAVLPGKEYAAQQVIVRKMIGGFTTVAGYWKWLEFLSQRITRDKVELVADFFSGKHNGHPRQFNKDFWLKNADENDGYIPVRVEMVGEGATFTGVPFPVAQIYGKTPAVWLNEPMYIQIGHLTYVATIAAQFAAVLGDPWRFIEVAFRALQNCEGSDDLLLAMLIGGGIISTSNDLGAFINGAPFKCSGTTGHCWYQQFPTLKEALRTLLGSPLGPYSTVLLDPYEHKHGFKELQEVLAEGYPAPFAERPDSGDTLKLGMNDLTALQDEGKEINVIFEDGKKPADVLEAEKVRRQYGLEEKRAIHGAGGAFLGQRGQLETAYKACYFHDGTPRDRRNEIDTMKICLDDPMKQSLPGMIQWFQNQKTGMYMIGTGDDRAPEGYGYVGDVLYDGLSVPGKPIFNIGYDPENLAQSVAVKNGVSRSKKIRELLGPSFTLQIGANKAAIGMTKSLRRKRKDIYNRALEIVSKK